MQQLGHGAEHIAMNTAASRIVELEASDSQP